MGSARGGPVGLARAAVNALSNLGFVVAGLAIGCAPATGRPRRADDEPVPGLASAYAGLVVLLGPGSMAMHATQTALGGHLHMISMFLVASFAASYAAMRRWRRWPSLFMAVAFAAAWAGVPTWSATFGGHVPVVDFVGTRCSGRSC